ncbi:hypothetical protein [Sphingomonas solaris]|uniref:Uncharacterized protein n=1 Tax=Alterirhizorhabdus solaris TaxID=2529389 RepID=A0A558R1F1_9SPHN|nr:hypothetical protein [Sphingomonas solaris]TVV73189.1 hypothetical protein FOY91_12935 [Sphingomonas solaris]
MRAFVKSVLVGSLAPAVPLMLITSFVGFSVAMHGGLLTGLYLATLPFIIALPIVLTCSLLIGLPFTALLRRAGRESATAYIIGGGIAGLSVPVMCMMLIGDNIQTYWLGLLGGFSGTVTGRTWWVSGRESTLFADIDS